jgi:hypothetical protein
MRLSFDLVVPGDQGAILEPVTDTAARQQIDDLGESMGETCRALGEIVAAMGRPPLFSSDEGTNTPAVFFPGTGTVLLQDIPNRARAGQSAPVTPILVDVEWATYFFRQLNDLLREIRPSAPYQGGGPEKRVET